jgi:hypothetical protein
MASAVHDALRQQGQVFGVAVLGAIVYAHRDYITGFRTALLPAVPRPGRPAPRAGRRISAGRRPTRRDRPAGGVPPAPKVEDV